MKTFIILMISLATYISTNNLRENKIQETFVGTFVGLDDDYQIQFKDAEDNLVIFNEVAEDVEVDLYDEENVNKKYEVSWEKIQIELYDEEGEATGEFEEGKRILALTELE